ncbi:hypothetical protein GF351_06040 [Candidatus Woesearchaeota archaeon]|nr:hypothetical protein [Candidatus Woesearchaeota archaeon]
MKNFISLKIFMLSMSDLINLLRGMRKLNDSEKQNFALLSDHMSSNNLLQIEKLVKQKRVKVELSDSNIQVIKSSRIPVITPSCDDTMVQQIASDANDEIRMNFRKSLFKEMGAKAKDIIPRFIAPNIAGMDMLKKAVALQLFAKDRVHILLLGDPGTGKTDIIRSAAEYSPVSSFGLGSGTSGVGLVATVKGNEVVKGLLPQADKGLCCIDELNLMKEDSRAGLYNAMEKGFVTYDKGGHHHKFHSRISVLSTANPKGDKFTGNSIRQLKAQLPFDPALLTRFHLVFFVRKPSMKDFRKITEKIVSGEQGKYSDEDMKFVKAYIRHALEEHGNVRFPKDLQSKIVDVIAEIKQKEEHYLVDISPRITVGFMRLCMASARMHLRDQVNQDDLDMVSSLLKESLKVF